MTQPTRFGRIPRKGIFFDEREALKPSEKQEKEVMKITNESGAMVVKCLMTACKGQIETGVL